MECRPRALAVVGPTAAGKTPLAIELARRFDGEIVSCDSVQIYKHLNIGSAKPGPEELAAARHHMIDLFEPDFRADVGLYKSLAEEAIRDILSRGKLPIVCGGTGLYFNALYYGLFEGPTRDNSIRAELEARFEAGEAPLLYQELRELDPDAASKIEPADKRRIIRALEVIRSAGEPISLLQKKNKKLDLNWFLIGLNMERAELYRRIEARTDAMIDRGLAEETRALAAAFGESAYALGAIGYRHALMFLRGEWNINEFRAQLKQDTRRYAKRQITWFRKISEIHWHTPGELDPLWKELREYEQ